MKLHKMLRLLKLQHPKNNVLAFRKRTSEMHENMSFVKLVLHLAEKEKKAESEPDDSSITDSDDDDNSASEKSSSDSSKSSKRVVEDE